MVSNKMMKQNPSAPNILPQQMKNNPVQMNQGFDRQMGYQNQEPFMQQTQAFSQQMNYATGSSVFFQNNQNSAVSSRTNLETDQYSSYNNQKSISSRKLLNQPQSIHFSSKDIDL